MRTDGEEVGDGGAPGHAARPPSASAPSRLRPTPSVMKPQTGIACADGSEGASASGAGAANASEEHVQRQDSLDTPAAFLASCLSPGDVAPRPADAQQEEQPTSLGVTWKKWAGRAGGEEKYQFGDMARSLVSLGRSKLEDRIQMPIGEAIRDLKHMAGDWALDLKEEQEQRIARGVEQLASGDAVQAATSSLAGPASQATAAERLWCQACQIVHQNHRREEEAQERPPDARGCLEVEVLEFGSEPELRRDTNNGEVALKPVCQLGLEGCLSKALHPAKALPATGAAAAEQDETQVSEARFYFQELADRNLHVHVFDRGSMKFQVGFEDQSFCGGAFIPLGAIARRGDLFETNFEAEVWVQLLPLKLIRSQWKLEPAKVGKPEHALGRVLLRLRMKLYHPPLHLLFLDPFAAPLRPSKIVGSVDPLHTVKSAGQAVGRLGAALRLVPVDGITALGSLREGPLSGVLLQGWWALFALYAPISLWPLLGVGSLLGAASRLRTICAPECEQLFQESAQEDDEEFFLNRAKDVAMGTAKKAAKAARNVQTAVDKATAAAEVLERIQIAILYGDARTFRVCCAMLLAASAAAFLPIQVILFLAQMGWLRTVLWICGGVFMLPRPVRAAAEQAKTQLRQLLGDKMRRRLHSFWLRLPDAVEECHQRLCERYAYDFVASQ